MSLVSRLSNANRVLPAIFFAWTFLLGCTVMTDTDIWWHLKAGEMIWERGGPPQVDWFTYTSGDRDWIDLHWGFQLLVAGIHSAWGVPGLVLLKAGLLTASTAIGFRAAGQGLPAWLRVAVWVLPAVCISGRAHERPEMVSLVFLATWLAIVPRLRERPRLVWALPAMHLVWTNCHALFVLGFLVGLAYAAERIARDLFPRWFGVPEPGPSGGVLVRAAGLIALATLANPYFLDGALFPLELFRKFSTDAALYADVGEFTPPWKFAAQAGAFAALRNVYFTCELVLAAATLASLVGVVRARRTVPAYRVLLWAMFAWLGWTASRNTSLFALVSGVVLSENLAELAPRGWGRRWIVDDEARRRIAATWLVLLCASVPTGRWAAFCGERTVRQFGFQELRAYYIHDAVRFVSGPEFPPRAFVTNFGQASVYIYHRAPEGLVFLDGRLEVASRETYTAFQQAERLMLLGLPGWEAIVADENGRMPVVIAATSRPFLTATSQGPLVLIERLAAHPRVRMVYADASCAVFVDVELARKLKLPERTMGELAEALQAELLRDRGKADGR